MFFEPLKFKKKKKERVHAQRTHESQYCVFSFGFIPRRCLGSSVSFYCGTSLASLATAFFNREIELSTIERWTAGQPMLWDGTSKGVDRPTSAIAHTYRQVLSRQSTSRATRAAASSMDAMTSSGGP